MSSMTEPFLDPALKDCPPRSKAQEIWIHSARERHFKCETCQRTFSERCGTPFWDKSAPSAALLEAAIVGLGTVKPPFSKSTLRVGAVKAKGRMAARRTSSPLSPSLSTLLIVYLRGGWSEELTRCGSEL